jgi:hypothetical protein
MTTNTTVPLGRSPALRGNATGVTILAFFAVAWLGWGTGAALPTAAQVPMMAGAVALSAVLATVAWRQWRNTTVATPDPPWGPDIGRRFTLIVAVEWVGVAAAASALGATGHQSAIPAVVCAGVGLHFIPLARLFGVPIYRVTAGVLCALAVATFALAPSNPPLWMLLPGVGAAVAMYGTCAVRLIRPPSRGR